MRRITSLRERVHEERAVLFGVPRPIEAMFYLPWPAYAEQPTREQARTLSERGYAVLVYDEASGTLAPRR